MLSSLSSSLGQVKIYLYAKPADMRKSFGTPGQAWRFQRVGFPPRQGVSRPTENRVLGSWR